MLPLVPAPGNAEELGLPGVGGGKLPVVLVSSGDELSVLLVSSPLNWRAS